MIITYVHVIPTINKALAVRVPNNTGHRCLQLYGGITIPSSKAEPPRVTMLNHFQRMQIWNQLFLGNGRRYQGPAFAFADTHGDIQLYRPVAIAAHDADRLFIGLHPLQFDIGKQLPGGNRHTAVATCPVLGHPYPASFSAAAPLAPAGSGSGRKAWLKVRLISLHCTK